MSAEVIVVWSVQVDDGTSPGKRLRNQHMEE